MNLDGDTRCSQGGFTMVELLMSAFILAIGILGLTMLQTMSVRSATSSRGQTTAIMLAEHIMDEVETNGRNSLLYARSTPPITPPDALTNVIIADATAPPDAPNRTYNYAGRPNTGDPIDTNPVYSVYIQPDRNVGTAGVVAPVARMGGIAQVTVIVQWVEGPAAATRQVTLMRRIAYATAI